MLAKVPPGTTDKPANYVLIKGDPGDANAKTFLPAGWDAGWPQGRGGCRHDQDPEQPAGRHVHGGVGHRPRQPDQHGSDHRRGQRGQARRSMRILAENDSTALGVVAALKNKSYGIVPISGQDGDTANLQNVAAGSAVRRRLEGRQPAGQGGRCRGASALQGPERRQRQAPEWDASTRPVLRTTWLSSDFTTPGNNVGQVADPEGPARHPGQPAEDHRRQVVDLPILCANATDPATAAPICAGAAPSPAAARASSLAKRQPRSWPRPGSCGMSRL